MKTYYLELVGLRMALNTPDEITISENLRPFLTAPQEQTDCVITLQSCAALPDFSRDGVWHGAEYYDTRPQVSRIFHCDTTDKTPFALTELFEDGNIEIRVLPRRLAWFAGSEGIFNRIGMETLLLQHAGLLLHASLIKYGHSAIAFTGPSGIGKSTQAALWERILGAELINGDRAALRFTPSGWIAYGSPYAGTSGVYKNENAKLAAIVVLRQAEENRLRRLTGAESFSHIYAQFSVHRWDKTFVAKATDLCLQMLADVPVYLLECRPDEDAVWLTKEGLNL